MGVMLSGLPVVINSIVCRWYLLNSYALLRVVNFDLLSPHGCEQFFVVGGGGEYASFLECIRETASWISTTVHSKDPQTQTCHFGENCTFCLLKGILPS